MGKANLRCLRKLGNRRWAMGKGERCQLRPAIAWRTSNGGSVFLKRFGDSEIADQQWRKVSCDAAALQRCLPVCGLKNAESHWVEKVPVTPWNTQEQLRSESFVADEPWGTRDPVASGPSTKRCVRRALSRTGHRRKTSKGGRPARPQRGERRHQRRCRSRKRST